MHVTPLPAGVGDGSVGPNGRQVLRAVLSRLSRTSGPSPVLPLAAGSADGSPPRTLISNGARQSLFKSKPPYETSFLKKLYDLFSLRNAIHLRRPRKGNMKTCS